MKITFHHSSAVIYESAGAATSGYTSNRRWVVTGIPDRVSTIFCGSMSAYIIASSCSVVAITVPLYQSVSRTIHVVLLIRKRTSGLQQKSVPTRIKMLAMSFGYGSLHETYCMIAGRHISCRTAHRYVNLIVIRPNGSFRSFSGPSYHQLTLRVGVTPSGVVQSLG